MPNSTLIFNYMCLGACFSQEAKLTTEVFIVAFWLGCLLLSWKRGWSKQGLKNSFCVFKRNAVVRFIHHLPTTNSHKIPSVNTIIKNYDRDSFFLIRLKSFSLHVKIPYVRLQIFCAIFLEILTIGSWEIGVLLQKPQSVSIFRATAHVQHSGSSHSRTNNMQISEYAVFFPFSVTFR